MTKTKKIIVIASMVLILAVAATLNIFLLSGGEDGGDSLTTGNFFMSYRVIREETRAEELANLDKIIALQGDEYAAARADAVDQRMKIVRLMETELVLEYKIKAKGYEDVVVIMGIYSDLVNVMVKNDQVTREDSAVIFGVIIQETNVSPELIHITPV